MATKKAIKVAIIGGSGLDNPELFDDRREEKVTTPFGDPSDCLIHGSIGGIDCVLLARHGRRHTIAPTNVNYRANLWALKEAGCTHVIASTACGSLQEHIVPGQPVFIDQFIDMTKLRPLTYYDNSERAPSPYVLHLAMAEPFCPETRQILYETARNLSIECHERGTMLTIEGPRFSTKAESRVWRLMQADCINMTTVPEVVLAKELGLCYAAIALPTDYDVWRDTEVSMAEVIKVFKANADKTLRIIRDAVPRIAQRDWADTIQKYHDDVQSSIMVPHD